MGCFYPPKAVFFSCSFFPISLLWRFLLCVLPWVRWKRACHTEGSVLRVFLNASKNGYLTKSFGHAFPLKVGPPKCACFLVRWLGSQDLAFAGVFGWVFFFDAAYIVATDHVSPSGFHTMFFSLFLCCAHFSVFLFPALEAGNVLLEFSSFSLRWPCCNGIAAVFS